MLKYMAELFCGNIVVMIVCLKGYYMKKFVNSGEEGSTFCPRLKSSS